MKATIVNGEVSDKKKYLDECQNWPGLKGMELTQKVSTKQIYEWNNESLWIKDKGYQINKKHTYHIVVIDYGCKKIF